MEIVSTIFISFNFIFNHIREDKLGDLLLLGTVTFLFICFVIVFLCKSYRSLLWVGAILVVAGLVSNMLTAMFVEFIFPTSNHASLLFQKDLLANTFLIIAAIGANLFATAICSKVKENNISLKTDQEYKIKFTHTD